MARDKGARPSWKRALGRKGPLILPAAHDALTARLIERAGFRAYQIGGFALSGARHCFPDIDLTHFGEECAGAGDIIAASSLPVLVDADDGYGDVKNVTRTIRGYEAVGASAIFIEDQVAPKKCGHMAGKEVVPAEVMVSKVRAAADARNNPDTFLLARTDAVEPLGVEEAIRRGVLYLKAGADGVFVEGLRNVEEMRRVGRAFKGTPLATTILEGGGKAPWVAPDEMYDLGFSMILYPTSVLFRATRAIERALEDLKEGRPMPADDAVDFDAFEEIVRLHEWAELEARFGKGK
jgi:2-methylisocitrate lyase-like PEP mutase family enzyme